MRCEWDEAKAEANAIKHGVAFERVHEFDWDTASIWPDQRYDYGEDRYIATGFIGQRLHRLIYTRRNARVRVIGLRKANSREVRQYEQTQTGPH